MLDTVNLPDDSGSFFKKNLQLLAHQDIQPVLRRIQRGIEKEGLRVNSNGALALTPHPQALGSALSNSWLTTDFSESLLEFITPVFESIEETIDYLRDIHALAYAQLNDEIIWGASMPCILPADELIPLAQYGSSNIAKMKTVYRRGLGLRYGRAMQTVAGIHYNFSLPEAFWRRAFDHARVSGLTEHTHLQSYIDERYFDLIRNFRRNYWLLIYLFGSAPCVDKSFIHNRDNDLIALSEQDLYYPNATSLRMGDLGYQSSAQKSLFVCYNGLNNYIETLGNAIKTPYPAYEEIGLKKGDTYQQLSTALLQIENEFYSPIRPKRVTHSGETPLRALEQRGVEYIEVRCMDINPMLASGIDTETIRFLDSFLLYCLLSDSPQCDKQEFERISVNHSRIVNKGRDPALKLYCGKTEVPMGDCANRLINGIESIAKQLDQAHNISQKIPTHWYTQSVTKQREKVLDVSLTPSAQVLKQMQDLGETHIDFGMRQSQKHANYYKQRNVDTETQERLMQIASDSLDSQRKIEQDSNTDFSSFLYAYYQQ